MSRPLTSLLALAVGISLLVLPAAPGGATTGIAATGSATIDLVPGVTIDLSNATAPCALGGAALDVTTAGSAPTYSGTADLTVLLSFTYQGATWFLWLDASSSAATITSDWWGTTLATGPLVPAGTAIYPEDASNPCSPDWWQPVCTSITLGAAAPVLDLSGHVASGSVSPPGLSGLANLAGTGRISASGCAAPFSTLNNRILTISTMGVPF